MANETAFKFDTSKLEKGLSSLQGKAMAVIEMKVATQYVPALRENAQENAPWENRTGEARRRLNSSYETVANGFNLVLAHGVDYGVWLELAHEKRYAIIMKTVEYVGVFDILPDFDKFIERLNRRG